MRLIKMIPLLLFGSILLAACGKEDIETNMSETVKPFEFTDQNGQKFGLEDLKGKWWVADFIFTNCTTVCLPMSANMARLQQSAKDEKLDVHFVSFSIDPDRDKPEVMSKYAASYGADTSTWHFLTGYTFQTIKEFSIKSFKSLAEKPPEGRDTDQFMHGTSFFLVNPEGKVIKNYSGAKGDEMDKIIDDLKKVQ